MNNKIKLAGLLVSISIAFSVYAKEDPKDVTVATVNGTSISKSTLDAYMAVVKRTSPNEVDVQSALDDLVVTEIAIQQARSEGLEKRDDVQAKVKDAARKILLTTWTQEKSESFEISDDDLKALYDDRMKKQAHSEYKARHILVKKEDEAKAIIKELQDGGDFEKLAKEKSVGPSKVKGGDLGWFKPATMVKPFAEAVEKMKKDSFTEAPVKTNFGWHIIKLEDKREAKLPSFEQLKPQMKRLKTQEKMINYINELKDKADVKVTLPKEMTEPKAKEGEDKAEKKAEEKKD